MMKQIRDIPIHERFKVEVNLGSRVSETTINYIQQVLSMALNVTRPVLPQGFSDEWETEDKAFNVKGTLPKRIAAYIKSQFNIKLDDVLISQLGERARSSIPTGGSFSFDFTDRMDWISGTYSDSGSCFFSDNSIARKILFDNDFRAIRFYSPGSNRGIGRALILPAKISSANLVPLNMKDLNLGPSLKAQTFPIVFNCYGSLIRPVIGNILESFLDCNSYNVSVYNNAISDGFLFINRGSGLLLLEKDSDFTACTRVSYDFQINTRNYSNPKCSVCKQVIEDTVYYNADFDIVCEDHN